MSDWLPLAVSFTGMAIIIGALIFISGPRAPK